MPRLGRFALVHLGLLLFALAIVVRSAQVQLVQHDAWARLAAAQHVAVQRLPAPRGEILDATGRPLVYSRESVKLAIAPREVRDRAALRGALRDAGVAERYIRRALDSTRRWVELPGAYSLDQVRLLLGKAGVHATPVSDRVYPSAEALGVLVGRVTDGEGRSGLELALDSLLRGTPGSIPMLRDAGLRRFDSPRFTMTPPQPGHSVVLTVHHAVQDIVERALADAVRTTGASGGDVVVVNPHTGELLALASLRRGRATTGVLTEPYEPGSTIKPILAARLLELGRARMDEVIPTPGGTMTPPGFRRPVRDQHVQDQQSLADVLRYSSNVGMIRFGERLTREEQYVALRDAGFGMPTGLPFPSEASGILPHPRRWSLATPASMAMGYGLSVTPVQLAMAFAAIANGGELLEPALVKEIRSPDGQTVWKAERRVVRRIMSEETARTMRQVLAGVVDSGTAKAARLTSFEVGGKTGTARNSAGGRYIADSYLASFVGLFPADDPQFVVLVKLVEPSSNQYYGGATAAPVSKVVLESALAARDAALDRSALVRSAVESARATRVVAGADRQAPNARVSERAERSSAAATRVLAAAEQEAIPIELGAVPMEAPPTTHVVPLVALDSLRALEEVQPSTPRPVPDVRGLPLRAAAYRLHASGFRVRLVNAALGETVPAAGSMAAPGSIVRLGRGR